jgi:hypothetical protein
MSLLVNAHSAYTRPCRTFLKVVILLSGFQFFMLIQLVNVQRTTTIQCYDYSSQVLAKIDSK